MTVFAASTHGKLLRSLGHHRRPSLGFLGESHGIRVAQVVQYALSRYYHADVIFDPRAYVAGGGGGYMFAIGGTDTNHLLNTQIPQFQAQPADIAFIANGYNDTGTAAAISAARILSAANSCLAAGALAVVIFSQTPYGTATAAEVVRGFELNTMLRNMCTNNPQLFYVDVTSILVDSTQASPSFKYRGAATGLFGSLTTDGTHWSATAMRQIAPQISAILQLFAPERRPRTVINAGNYDPVNHPYCNIIGDCGDMMGTAGIGYSSGFDTGVPGINSSNRLNTSQQGLSGATFTNSIVQDPTDGHNMLRISMSGTPTTSGAVSVATTLSITNPNNSDSTRTILSECEIRLNGVSGFIEPELRPLGSLAYDTLLLSQSGGACDVYPNTTSENLFMYTTVPQPLGSTNNPTFTIWLYFINGIALTGSIDIGRFGAYLTQ